MSLPACDHAWSDWSCQFRALPADGGFELHDERAEWLVRRCLKNCGAVERRPRW